MIFARERFSDFAMELGDMLKLHYSEIGWRRDKVPLKFDWAGYFSLDQADMLIAFTGREGGELRAYATFTTVPSLHHSLTRTATNDMIFVHPSNRGTAGIRLIDYAEKELRALGFDVIGYHVQKQLDWSAILERKGYEAQEVSMLKWIGE